MRAKGDATHSKEGEEGEEERRGEERRGEERGKYRSTTSSDDSNNHGEHNTPTQRSPNSNTTTRTASPSKD